MTKQLKSVYEQDIEHALGANKDDALWSQCLSHGTSALQRLQALAKSGEKPFLTTPDFKGDYEEIERIADDVRSRIKHLVLIGTGGSALGARALSKLMLNPEHRGFNDPRLHVLDNADPFIFARLMKIIDPKTTMFMVVSKSGGTAEIMAQTFAAIEFMRKHVGDAQLAKHFHVIVEPGDSSLRKLAARLGFSSSEHDPNIGGRYSVLSLVGLMPMACIGLDVKLAREGASYVMHQVMEAKDAQESDAILGACVQAYHAQKNRPISVMMPYGDLLRTFGHWYQQLVAESLGKDGKGVTPLAAVGAVDQHSMQQLFLDGPDDKFFTFVKGNYAGRGAKIDTLGIEGLEYIDGRHIGDVLQALQYGTVETFINRGRPVRVLDIDYPTEDVLGALMQHFMVETVVAADILQINPYDQPAVEDGKKLARAYLQKQRVQGAA
jgi:glucose-6-phosphate isomerase